MDSISTQALKDKLAHLETEEILVDVREPFEFTEGHIEGAVNIPLSTIQSELSSLKNFKTVYVNCRSGGRSAQACTFLTSAGIHAVNVEGGIIAWNKSGLS